MTYPLISLRSQDSPTQFWVFPISLEVVAQAHTKQVRPAFDASMHSPRPEQALVELEQTSALA